MIKKISVSIICLVFFVVSSVDAKLCNQKFDFSDYSASNAALRSALLPGWGQGWNEQETKGWIIFGVFVASACTALHFNNEAEKNYKLYAEIGAPAGSEYDNYKRNFDTARILATVAVLTWIYAVTDAYFVAKKEQKKYVSKKVNLVMYDNDGFKLEYKTKFSI
ncbi:MAG: DUF5683 domain-containing protein [Endomicrobiaceae bacterium]|nr:DUF5683 domain-containing protein [Endomicrobiaceae bacterium]